MEALFKESPHPDEKQRQQLSEQLGLSARQVKFWFQNRRTQIKAIQERHENSLLKSELEKLQEEHRAMRELVKKPSRCPNCGVAGDVAALATQEQRLRLENAKLKAEARQSGPSFRSVNLQNSDTGGGELISGREATGDARSIRRRRSHLAAVLRWFRFRADEKQEPVGRLRWYLLGSRRQAEDLGAG
ncbi:hypothetical protein GUJ93_ZPchr0007g5121 [Zizania palustris]|uniref:Homeobox domain-containing protein n=1 Tax=Zizania palustris TaxID=103762 RepID=A0A8J5T3H4_ZIZPA|nr:hypothetical protein GUJ93_ZPchr0007g5121 [Zizania palustris]